MTTSRSIARIFWHRVGSSNAARGTPLSYEGCGSKHEASAGICAAACFVAVMLVAVLVLFLSSVLENPKPTRDRSSAQPERGMGTTLNGPSRK